MKRVYMIFYSLLVVTLFSCNQPATNTSDTISETGTAAAVSVAVDQLMKGIVEANLDILDNITAEGLVYGHSGGVVQNKTEFIDEILSGKPLDYLKVDLIDQTINIIGNAAVARHIFIAETVNAEGDPVNLRLGNVLVWQFQEGNWKLIVRQAYKL